MTVHALEAADLLRRWVSNYTLTPAERQALAAFVAAEPNLAHDLVHVEAHAAGMPCPCVAAGHACRFEEAGPAAC